MFLRLRLAIWGRVVAVDQGDIEGLCNKGKSSMKSEIKRALKSSLQTAVDISRKTKVGQYLHNQNVNMAMDSSLTW